MIQYLQDQQFSEKYGFDLNSPPYGGWGFGINQKPTLGSFVDLAHTRRVLQSLNHANAITNQIKNRSEYFLNRLQKRKQAPNNYRTNWIPKYGYDGGFFPHQLLPMQIKAELELIKIPDRNISGVIQPQLAMECFQ